MDHIDDGYTERWKCKGTRLELVDYRPMLQRERQWSLLAMREHQEFHGWQFADWCMARHVTMLVEAGASVMRPSFQVLETLRKTGFEEWKQLFELIFGIGKTSQEEADRRNLTTGVRLLAKFPHLRGNTCDECQLYVYDPERGQFEVDAAGERFRRFPEDELACKTYGGCPNGTPEYPLSLSEKNRRALVHYQECAAVGRFPDDAIVRRNAAVIRAALEDMAFERNRRRAAPARIQQVHGPVFGGAFEGSGVESFTVPAGSDDLGNGGAPTGAGAAGELPI